MLVCERSTFSSFSHCMHTTSLAGKKKLLSFSGNNRAIHTGGALAKNSQFLSTPFRGGLGVLGSIVEDMKATATPVHFIVVLLQELFSELYL